MPRFYFHLYNSVGSAPDEQGLELPDQETAERAAVEDIRSIMSEEVKEGRADFAGRIEIADEQGRHLATVQFKQAVELKL